jgi:hypothetical protein
MPRSILPLAALALTFTVGALRQCISAEELVGSFVTAASDFDNLESSDYLRLDAEDCACECMQCDMFCRPLWTITSDALFWHRSDPAARALIINTSDPAQGLNANRLQPGFQTGFDLSAIRQIGAAWSVEARYFGFNGWHGAATTATTPGDLLQLNSAIPVFTFAGSAIQGDLTSRVHNAELNGRWQRSESIALLGGFRYLELDDRLQINLVNSAVPFAYDTQTRNRLYGCQAGGQVWLWNNGGPWSLDVTGKVGIFGNAAAQNSNLSTGVVTLSSGRLASRAAFVGELGITGRYQWTDYVALRGGYRLLWIDQVTLGTDQVAVTAFVPPNLAPGAGIDPGGNLFFHGAFAGLECSW